MVESLKIIIPPSPRTTGAALEQGLGLSEHGECSRTEDPASGFDLGLRQQPFSGDGRAVLAAVPKATA